MYILSNSMYIFHRINSITTYPISLLCIIYRNILWYSCFAVAVYFIKLLFIELEQLFVPHLPLVSFLLDYDSWNIH